MARLDLEIPNDLYDALAEEAALDECSASGFVEESVRREIAKRWAVRGLAAYGVRLVSSVEPIAEQESVA